MSRYIDADLLSTDIQRYQCVSCSAEYSKDNIRCSACEIAECLRMIDNAPTADVSEVKHGQLICVQAEPEKVRCDYCKTDYYSSDLLNIGADEGKVNFCPNCGAKLI